MTDLAANRQQVLSQIKNICRDCGISVDKVTLLAVSKTQPADVIRAMYAAGQRIFAENYLQEALSKQADLTDLTIEWHFIGQIQRNKTRDLATNFSWIHGVDRLIIARRLSQHLAEQIEEMGITPTPLNICIQVNIDHEDSKAGCLPEELADLVEQISVLPHLALRGIMVIPEVNHQDAFVRAQALFESVRARHMSPECWDTLSMGMSGDFADAIAAGSTMVRVGTALFGARTRPQNHPENSNE
ncbi:MAG TPA: YggS family pyridoxal phosphate-dependent enzyme [Aquirhabdus sp.]